MATGASDSQNQPKQGVFVYPKSKSFAKASSAVENLLKDICESMGNIEVKPYGENYKLEDYLGVTVVVVIDSQQIRKMNTPERKDRNVDNWDDLKRLSSTRTFPTGSILIVIHGTDSTKDGHDLIAKKWLQVLQSNGLPDRYAKKNTTFPIYSEFNETQKESIKHYMRMVPLYPSITGKEMNILFLSPRTEREQMKQFLDSNPFVIRQTEKPCGKCQAIKFSSYIQLNDSAAGCLKIHYIDYPIIDLPAEKSFESILKNILAPMKKDSQGCKCHEIRSFPSVFDRLIFCCRAREPFQISNQTEFRHEIEQLKDELACFNLQLRGEAFSIVKDEQKNESSDSTNGLPPSVTKDSRRSAILFLERQSKDPLVDQRDKILQRVDDDLLCRSHAYHLMQSPTLFEPNLSLNKEEMEIMTKEKEALESEIKLWKTKLSIKKDRASDLEKKLTGKGEGYGRWSLFNLFSKN